MIRFHSGFEQREHGQHRVPDWSLARLELQLIALLHNEFVKLVQTPPYLEVIHRVAQGPQRDNAVDYRRVNPG